MPASLEDEAKALLRQYRMNWEALKKIKRQDRSLAVGIDIDKGTGNPVCYLFNAYTNEFIGNFANVEWAEILILREAGKLYGSILSSADAVEQYEKLLKESLDTFCIEEEEGPGQWVPVKGTGVFFDNKEIVRQYETLESAQKAYHQLLRNAEPGKKYRICKRTRAGNDWSWIPVYPAAGP